MVITKNRTNILFFSHPCNCNYQCFNNSTSQTTKFYTKKNKTALKNKETVLNSLSATQKRQGKLIMKKIFIYLTAASVNNTLTPTFSEDCMAGRFSAVNIYVTNGGP